MNFRVITVNTKYDSIISDNISIFDDSTPKFEIKAEIEMIFDDVDPYCFSSIENFEKCLKQQYSKFTKGQIDIALKNTYPEYFI